MSIAPPLVVGLWFLLRGKAPAWMKPIVFLLLTSLIADQVAAWAADEFKNNMPVFHAYAFAQAALLFWFFHKIIRNHRKTIQWIAFIYLGYSVINSIWIEPILTFNQTARIVQNILFLAISIFFFYDYYQKESTLSPEKDGTFWVVVGILTYYSGTLFTYLLSAKILSTPNDSFFGGWIIHNFSNTLKNLILFAGLWIGKMK